MSTTSRFTHRNLFYLRASPDAVLQTILYLDHRHLQWFNANPHILNMLLAVLKTRIMPKLRREADKQGALSNMSKKEKVDVYSEKDWQVAYFFRKMDDRHAVLLKEKSLVFPDYPSLSEVKVEDESGNLHAPIPQRGGALESQRQASVSIKSEQDASPAAIDVDADDDDGSNSDVTVDPEAGRSPSRSEAAIVPDSDDEEAESASGQEENVNTLFRGGSVFDDDGGDGTMPPPRRSKRRKVADAIEVKDEIETSLVRPDEELPNDAIEITQEDEEKTKPRLSVKYAGFRIFGKLLVLVVEPTKRYISEHSDLLGEKEVGERRQLSVAPVSVSPMASSSRNARATSMQSQFTSVEPSNRSGRNASVARGDTPLFRGMTPATEAGTPAPSSIPPPPRPSATVTSVAASGSRENWIDVQDDADDEAAGELEGFQLATQMLEREGSVMGTGNDLDEGD